MIKKKKYYVYMHLYKGDPVYIGKGSVDYNTNKSKGGSDRRSNAFYRRNERYTNFIKEVGKENIEVRIVARFDEESDALWLEDELHEVYDNLYSLSNKQAYSKKSKRVVQLTLDEEFVAEYPNASRAESFDHRNINMCCNKKRCTYNGFKWLFADEYYNGNYSFKKDMRKNY